MINERTRRRPGFNEKHAYGVTLADGQVWYLPRPFVEVRCKLADGRTTIASARTTHGEAFDEALDLVTEAETVTDQIIGIMTIGAFLLREAYALTDTEIEGLLVFRLTDDGFAPESLEMVKAIAKVAMGATGERNFPDGSGSH